MRTKKQFFRLRRKVPLVQRIIDAEMNKATNDFEGEIAKNCANLSYSLELPLKGLSHEEILTLVNEHLSIGSYNWREGRVSGAVYGYKEELVDLITKVYGKASYTNPLHPDLFPGICKMEAEVVRMACTLYHGDIDSCGTVSIAMSKLSNICNIRFPFDHFR